MLGKARDVAAHDRGIHAELGLRELRAGRDLGSELVRLPAWRRIDRRVGGAEEEPRGAGDLAPGGELVLVAHAALRSASEWSRSISNTRFGLRLVAGFGVVAGHQQKVADAARRGADSSACSAMRLRSRQVS